jgi:hypothetical protein
MDRSKEWLIPLTGVAFILLVVASFIIVGDEPPDAEESAQEIADYYVDNRSEVQIGAFVGTCAGALLIFFFGYLRKVLREAGAGSTLSLLPLIGATIVSIGAAIDGTISFALAEAADDIEPESVRTLQALWDSDFMPFALGFQVLWLAAGVAILRHGGLPKWLGWFAILFGVLAFTPIGFVAFPGGALWVLIVSIMLTLRARSGPPAPAPAP